LFRAVRDCGLLHMQDCGSACRESQQRFGTHLLTPYRAVVIFLWMESAQSEAQQQASVSQGGASEHC